MTRSPAGLFVTSVAAAGALCTALTANATPARAQEGQVCTVNRVDPLNPFKRVGEDSINLSVQKLAEEIERALPADSPSAGMPTQYLAISNVNKRMALVRGIIREVPSPLRGYAFVREAEEVLLENVHDAEARAHDCAPAPQAAATDSYLKGYVGTPLVIGEGGVVHYDNENEPPLVAESRPFTKTVAMSDGTQVRVTLPTGRTVVAMGEDYWNLGTAREKNR